MANCHAETNGEMRLAKLLIPTSRVVFDVGAREDDDFVRLSDKCDFHLFEPSRDHCQALAEKTRGRTNVTINPCALGDVQGTAWIYPDCESLIQRTPGKSERMPITVKRLDDYCREKNIHQIDFIKIDTEGYELEVLKGGSQIIQSATRVVQFEYGGTYPDAGITLRMVFDFLGPHWSFYRVHPDHLLPIKAYRPRYEDGRYANYVASREPLPPAVVGPSAIRRLLSGHWLRSKAS